MAAGEGHRDRTWNSDFGIWWQTDSSTSECNVCQSPFHLMKRRHHCRFCGTPPAGANAHTTQVAQQLNLWPTCTGYTPDTPPMLHYLAHPHNLCQWRHSSTLPLIISHHHFSLLLPCASEVSRSVICLSLCHLALHLGDFPFLPPSPAGWCLNCTNRWMRPFGIRNGLSAHHLYQPRSDCSSS